MKIQVAEIEPYGSVIVVAIVESAYTAAEKWCEMLRRLQPYFRFHPIMLVSLETNGFRARAHFQTHLLLALIQLEVLSLREVDLAQLPAYSDESLPF